MNPIPRLKALADEMIAASDSRVSTRDYCIAQSGFEEASDPTTVKKMIAVVEAAQAFCVEDRQPENMLRFADLEEALKALETP